MRKLTICALLLCACSSANEVAFAAHGEDLGEVLGPPLTGSTTVVNNTAGADHTDPHLSGDLAAYTTGAGVTSAIHYQHLGTGVDNTIPTSGGFDFLSDVSGTKIVFSRATPGTKNAIMMFDTATGAAPVVLSPAPASDRDSATIGGNTVAWQERTTNPNAQIVAYDLAAGIATTLSSDATKSNLTPAVSPDGNLVVWIQCQPPQDTGCNVMQAVRAGRAWTASQLTTTGDASHPDTNGQVVVYARGVIGRGSAVYRQPVGGGVEHHITLAGSQANPSISGNWISFDTYDASGGSDIWVYDISTDTAYQVTNTPQGESLTDLSVSPSGLVRVVWQVLESLPGQFNVYAFSFQAPSSCIASSAPGCVRPLLATLELKSPVSPDFAFASASFRAIPTKNGLLCVENGVGGTKATFGFATVNFQPGVTPVDFATTTKPTIVKPVELESTNWFLAGIAGQPGTAFRASVFGADPCAPLQ